MLKSLLQNLIKILPLNTILDYLLSVFEDLAKKTSTKIDDEVIKFLRITLNEVDITASGIKYHSGLDKYFNEVNLKTILNWFIDQLERFVKSTETELDDEVLEFFKDILGKYLE